MLVVFALGFGAAMTIAAKGFDRYLLPIFPILDLLAGVGLWRLATVALALSRTVDRFVARGLVPRLYPSCASGGRPPRYDRPLHRCGIAGHRRRVAGWSVVSAWPYELTYANPLVGGNPAAHRTIASGWGEGLDQAAALSERPLGPPGASRLRCPARSTPPSSTPSSTGTVAPPRASDAGAYDALVVYLRNRPAWRAPAVL